MPDKDGMAGTISSTKNSPLPDDRLPLPQLIVRSSFGGILMGLANLVPGISGGTMLLVAGVYPKFIRAVAEITTLRFRIQSLVLLMTVAITAGAAVLSFAGPVKTLVIEHRWIMYSLFIGLTLGGIPVVWKLISTHSFSVWVSAAVGLIAMIALVLAQSQGNDSGASEGGLAMMFVAGVAGASAMILPGVSGGYLLLVLGAYVPLLTGLDAMKQALKAHDLTAAIQPTLHVVLPVGIGVLIGIAVVSNILRLLLARYEKATLGALLGLLMGAVVGLYPFQEGVPPEVDTVFKGDIVEKVEEQLVMQTTGKVIAREDFPTRYFNPNSRQMAISAGVIIGGLILTYAVAILGRDRTPKTE